MNSHNSKENNSIPLDKQDYACPLCPDIKYEMYPYIFYAPLPCDHCSSGPCIKCHKRTRSESGKCWRCENN